MNIADNEKLIQKRINALQALANGHPMKQAAEAAGMKTRGVEGAMMDMRRRNKCRSTFQLIALAMSEGIITYQIGVN